ncbi:MAG: TonB-dependent receptor [bacterium]|nr:TonB-dependent receptor [bacterium]
MRGNLHLVARVFLTLCTLVLVPTSGLAQGVTSGDLTGVVVDPNGDPIPGAQVSAHLLTTGAQYSDVTDSSGRFNILNARVGGPYLLTAGSPSFHTEEIASVFVRLGEETHISIQLRPEIVEAEEILVTASNTLISPSRTGAASNVSLEQLQSMPTVERSLFEFARSNPLIAMDANNDESTIITIAGRNNRYNTIQIDGSVNSDVFGLSASGVPGGQTETQPISIDAIQELQLVIAPFDVRQSGFSGGGINAITKYGTNTFKGSVYAFMFDDDLVGSGPDEFSELGTFEEKQIGFSLGGPIARDKVFFFVNAEMSRRESPTGWSLDGQEGQAWGNENAQAAGQRFIDIMQDQYGYDPGDLSQQSLNTDSDKLFAKIDFQISPSHSLTIRHNYNDSEHLILAPTRWTYEFPSHAYLMENTTNSSVAQLNSVFGDDRFNELRVTYQSISDRRAGGTPFPYVRIEDADGSGGEFEAGIERFSTANSLDQTIMELHDDFTFFKGDHEITVGTHNEIISFENLFIQEYFGAYRFETMDDFEAGVAQRFDHSYPVDNDPYDRFDAYQIGVYAGDRWRARSNFTLTLGLRADIPFFPDKPAYNPLVDETFGVRTDQIPDGNVLWSPRFGFNWDIGGKGIRQLRGGAGIFSGRTPFVWVSNVYARTGLEQVTLQANEEVPFNPDPFDQPTDIGGATSQDVNAIDPNFKFPQVQRFNLAYDQRLPWWNLVASAEFLHARSMNEVRYRNLNIRPTGEYLPFDGRPVMEKVSDDFVGLFYLDNTNQGEQTNLTLKLERPYGDGVWGFVAYTWGDSQVANDGTSSRAISNWQYHPAVDPNNIPTTISTFEIQHRFTASLSYAFNRNSAWTTTLSAFYNHQSGRPFSIIYDWHWDSINNDGFGDNDLVYIPSGPGDVIISNGTWDDLYTWIKSAGLEKYMGKIAPRNASRAPWSHTLDLHVDQQIPVGYGSLLLTFDIFNFLNMLDADSGHRRYVQYDTVDAIAYGGYDEETGVPIYHLNGSVFEPEDMFDIDNLRSRWRMKLGVRWTF